MTALPAALALAKQGLALFPCRGEKKQPACLHGFKDALSEARAVETLFHRYPGELVGVPTGSVNGIDVLDIDPRHGGTEWQDEFATYLPQTRIHATRSGGTHYLFQHHPGIKNTASKIAPGVDTRGDGGYIIWWPAAGLVVPSIGPLAPWPQWLLDQLLPAPGLVVTPETPISIASDKHARRLIQRCLDRVSRSSPGQRHYALRSASFTIGGIVGSGLGSGKAEAARALLDAVLAAGGIDVDVTNAKATIMSGLEKGSKAPLARLGR